MGQRSPLMVQLRDRKQLEGKCGTCEFSSMCSGCRARAFAETGNYMSEDPSCDYEPGKHGGKEITLKIEDTLGLEVEFHTQWTPEAQQRLERIPSFARGMVVKGIERFAEERNITLIDEDVVKEIARGDDRETWRNVPLPQEVYQLRKVIHRFKNKLH